MNCELEVHYNCTHLEVKHSFQVHPNESTEQCISVSFSTHFGLLQSAICLTAISLNLLFYVSHGPFGDGVFCSSRLCLKGATLKG